MQNITFVRIIVLETSVSLFDLVVNVMLKVQIRHMFIFC